MNNNVSSYLSSLQSDKANLIENLKAKGVKATSDETFTSLVPKVLDIPSGGGGDTDVYRVTSIEERDNLNAKEGDICVVISNDIRNITVEDKPTRITFPDVVTLPAPSTSRLDIRSADRSTIRISGSISSSTFSITLRDSNAPVTSVRIRYTSTDGLTYTKTEGNLTYDLSAPIEYYTYLDDCAYFIQIGGINFSGLFTYADSSWSYTDIGSYANAEDIQKDKVVYTNEGTITGTTDITSMFNNLLSVGSTEPEIKKGIWFDTTDTTALKDYSISCISGDPLDNTFVHVPDQHTNNISLNNVTSFGEWRNTYFHVYITIDNVYYRGISLNNGLVYCVKADGNDGVYLRILDVDTLELTDVPIYKPTGYMTSNISLDCGYDETTNSLVILGASINSNYYVFLYNLDTQAWTNIELIGSSKPYPEILVVHNNSIYTSTRSATNPNTGDASAITRTNLTTGQTVFLGYISDLSNMYLKGFTIKDNILITADFCTTNLITLETDYTYHNISTDLVINMEATDTYVKVFYLVNGVLKLRYWDRSLPKEQAYSKAIATFYDSGIGQQTLSNRAIPIIKDNKLYIFTDRYNSSTSENIKLHHVLDLSKFHEDWNIPSSLYSTQSSPVILLIGKPGETQEVNISDRLTTRVTKAFIADARISKSVKIPINDTWVSVNEEVDV